MHPSDIVTIDRVCFPVLQNHEMETLNEHLGIEPKLDQRETMGIIHDALV